MFSRKVKKNNEIKKRRGKEISVKEREKKINQQRKESKRIGGKGKRDNGMENENRKKGKE